MEEIQENKEDQGIGSQNRGPNRTTTGRYCKGCLFYSSIRKSKSQNPMCVGLNGALQQVPSYIVQESESEASKEERSLTDFKYACVGYSVHLDKRDPSADPHNKQAELPFCVGVELLLDKRPSHLDHVPAHVIKREDDHLFPHPRTYKPSHSPWDEFLTRFTRNAGVVASGVARNVYRAGNRIKNSVDDILYPYRRRPK